MKVAPKGFDESSSYVSVTGFCGHDGAWPSEDQWGVQRRIPLCLSFLRKQESRGGAREVGPSSEASWNSLDRERGNEGRSTSPALPIGACRATVLDVKNMVQRSRYLHSAMECDV